MPALPARSVAETLGAALALAPGRQALVDGAVRLTRHDLRQRVEAIAASFFKLGFRAGDRCVVHGANSWRWCAGALAAFRVGMTVAPLSGSISSHERLEPILQRIRPDLVLAGSTPRPLRLAPTIEACSWDAWRIRQPLIIDMSGDPSAPGLTLDTAAVKDSDPFMPPSPELDEDQTALILLTSGTTGEAKAVAHSQRSVRSLLNVVRRAPQRELLTTPLSHLFGQWQLLTMVMGGGGLVLPQTTAAGNLEALVVAESIDLLSGPPSIFTKLLASGSEANSWLRTLARIVVSADMAPPRAIAELLRAGLNLEDQYAMTECPAIARTEITGADSSAKRAWDGTQIRVVDEGAQPVPPGVVGAVEVRGERLFQGYLDRNGRPVPVAGGDGWFRTGDQGALDGAGHLVLHGRDHEMFICHGHNVFPAEVERQMMRSGWLTAAVLVARPSRLSGQEGVAFVVPENPTAFDLKAFRGYLRTWLDPWKLPVRFIVMDALPVNENGKVDRNALTEQLRGQQGASRRPDSNA